jgi:hypothetical protein
VISTARLPGRRTDCRSFGHACFGDVPSPVLSESPITTTLTAVSIDTVSNMPPDVLEVERVDAGCLNTDCGWTPAGAHALKTNSSAAAAAVILGRLRRDDCSIYASNSFSNDKIHHGNQ